ncbi:MAG: hypothetical protein Q9166_003243 [cf. Caloplaca sp. 2 TL-2023]
MAQCPKEELEYIINHVFLPLKLPQKAEDQSLVAKAEEALLSMVLSLVRRFHEQSAPEVKSCWIVIERMLSSCIATELFGDLSEELLTEALLTMRLGDAFPVRIRAQNAAIIFRRIATAISLECFEISPRSGDVVSCKGSLRRVFPAQARIIPLEIARRPGFYCELLKMLKRLDTEVVDEMMPQSRKAKSDRAEIRDTCHPGLVTELLMATLSAVGKPLKIRQIQKRIRDDVIWKNSLLPWRRSTLWLVLRVSIQTTLSGDLEPIKATAEYKNFMVYLLVDMLRLASTSDIDLDICKMMQMKIARRVAKLSTAALPFVQRSALSEVEKTSQEQRKVWQEIQSTDANRETQIDTATIEADTVLTLLNSRPALDAALQSSYQSLQTVIPIESRYPEWLIYGDNGLPSINRAVLRSSDTIYALAEFERWVSQSLPAWLDEALLHPYPVQCTSIAKSAEVYKSSASNTYSGCPELLSAMLLTVGEMWLALDKLAGSILPLLHRYSPEVATDVFTTLLLPKKAQMERLHRLELHITERHKDKIFHNSSTFSDDSNADVNCFASRFFEQSSDHQELRQRILDNASQERDEKKREWQQKTNRYNTLTSEVAKLTCATVVDNRGQIQHDKKNCQRCTLDLERRQMRIAVFEWPLPEDKVQCRLAVFNLRCPETFAAWQNLTWMLIQDLGRSEGMTGDDPKGFLASYPGLQQYYETSNSRVVLAATVKSIQVSHYRQLEFPTRLENVFSEHSLQYKLYDKDRGIWICDQTEGFWPIKLNAAPNSICTSSLRLDLSERMVKDLSG